MQLKLLAILLIILCGLSAQDLTYTYIDEQSYQLFINKKNPELKDLGDLALKQNIDFFLLRLRLGIIYYEEKNYDLALEHFLIALSSNPADEVLQEYLYFTYLFGNRLSEADNFGYSLSESMKNKINFKLYAKELLSFELGSLSTNQNKKIDQNIKGNLDVYGETVYQTGMDYLQLNLNKKLDQNYNLLLGLSIFNTKSIGVSQRFDKSQSEDFNLQQTQINVASLYKLQDSFILGFGLAFYKQNYSYLTSYVDTNFSSPIFYSANIANNNFSINTSLSKRFNYFDANISFAYSNLRNRDQAQGELALTYYPFGNANLYSVSKASIIYDNKKYKSLFAETIGFKAMESLWLESYYSFGDHTNYISQLGFLTYNTTDAVMKNFGLDISYFWEDINFVASYISQERKGSIYNAIGFNLYEQNYYTYQSQLIKVALKWKF